MADLLEQKIQDLASGGVSDTAVDNPPTNLDSKLESISTPEPVNLDAKLEVLSSPIQSPVQEQPRVVWDGAISKAIEIPGWYHGGQIGKAFRDNFRPEQEDVGEIGRSFLRSWLQLPEAVGELVRFVGDHIGSSTPFGMEKAKTISDFESKIKTRILDQGDLIVNTWKNLQNAATVHGVELTRANPDIWRGSFSENPSYTRGVATVLQAVPSLAVGYVTTLGTGIPFTGAVLAGLLDGLQTRGEARSAGKSVADQDKAFGAVAFFSTLMEDIPLTKFLEGGKGKLAGAVEGLFSEGITEGLQQFWQNAVAKIGYEPSRDLMQGVIESLVVGAATGGALGGATSHSARTVDRALNKLRLSGMSEEQINAMPYNMAVGLAESAKTPIFTTQDDQGNPIKVSLDELIGARLAEVAKVVNPESVPSVDIAVSPEIKREVKNEEIAKTIEAAGGKFIGIVDGFTKKDGTEIPGRIMFNAPSGTTLAIKTNDFSLENVSKKLSESQEKFTPKEMASQESPVPDNRFETAIKETPDTVDTLESNLPTLITDLQTITAKINEARSQNRQPEDSLIQRQNVLTSLLNDLQFREYQKPNLSLKSTIRKITGQVELAPKMVTEMSALKASLSSAAKTALTTELQTTRDLNNLKKGIVGEIKRFLPPSKERGSFLSAIASAKDGADIHAIAERVERTAENYKRKELLKEIKKQVKKAESSGAISVEYVSKISDLMDGFSSGMTPELKQKLKGTQDFINTQRASGKETDIPQYVLDQIDGLYREDLKDLDSNALQTLLNDIVLLRDLGKTKLQMRKALEDSRVSQALIELAAGTKKMESSYRVVSPFGEPQSLRISIKNTAADIRDWFINHQRGFTFVDTVFDQLDGNVGYSGPNYRIFKSSANSGYRQYLNLRDPIRTRVNNLAKRLGLTPVDMNKIGFYAVKVQENGPEKLEKMGFDREFIDSFTLDKNQSEMYIAFRSELDAIWPRVKSVLQQVYNLNPESLQNYFPFSTDFEAMNSRPIEERFGQDTPDLIETILKGNQSFNFNKTTPDKSFSFERVGGSQALKLNAMQVFLNHIDNATYLAAMGERLKHMAAVARNPSYFDIAGNSAQQFVTDWIDVLSRNGRRTDKVDLVDTLRKNTGYAALAFRLSSILVQGTALMDGAASIGPAAFEGAYKIATSKEWRDFVVKNMPEIRDRIGDDPFYAEFGSGSKIDKLNDTGFWALQKFDSITASGVAVGAYLKFLRDRGIAYTLDNPNSIPLNETALNYAQDIVGRTQSTAFPKDLPLAFNKAKLFKSGDAFNNTSINRLLLQFQNFTLKRWDTLTHQGIDLGFKKGDIAKGANVMSFLVLAKMAEYGTRGALSGLISQMVSAATGSDAIDREKDSELKKLLLNILGDIPFINGIVSATSYGSIPVPAIQTLSKFVERTAASFSAKTAEAKTRNAIRAALLGLGILAGVGGTTQAEDIYATATQKKRRFLA